MCIAPREMKNQHLACFRLAETCALVVAENPSLQRLHILVQGGKVKEVILQNA